MSQRDDFIVWLSHTSYLGWARLYVDMLKAVAWPIVAITAFLTFRKGLNALLTRAIKLKGFGGEAEFGDLNQAAVAVAGAIDQANEDRPAEPLTPLAEVPAEEGQADAPGPADEPGPARPDQHPRHGRRSLNEYLIPIFGPAEVGTWAVEEDGYASAGMSRGAIRTAWFHVSNRLIALADPQTAGSAPIHDLIDKLTSQHLISLETRDMVRSLYALYLAAHEGPPQSLSKQALSSISKSARQIVTRINVEAGDAFLNKPST
jgi:hypothetical protein